MKNLDPTPKPQDEVIEGWREIARHISERLGIFVTKDATMRWARGTENGRLPVRRWGPGKRLRVLASTAALDRWCDRWFRGPEGSQPTPSSRSGE